MTHGEELINMKVLMVDDELSAQTASGRVARALIQGTARPRCRRHRSDIRR